MSRKGKPASPPKRPDRRIGRTRRRLKEALLELIQERGYDEITIRDITERADVGRSTFYSHFDSKEDLLFSGFDHWLLSLVHSHAPPDAAGLRFSLPLLRHVRSQKRFVQATIVGGRESAIRRTSMDLMARMIQVELARHPRSTAGATAVSGVDEKVLLEARATCVAGAFFGLVAWWLDDARRLSAEVVDGVFQDVVGAAGG
jgi:AcrR family transcriptional regulator